MKSVDIKAPTNMDDLKACFDRIGIKYNVSVTESCDEMIQTITLPDILGYNGIFTEFNFDSEGEFVDYGAFN